MAFEPDTRYKPFYENILSNININTFLYESPT